jgi:hypothetical protein
MVLRNIRNLPNYTVSTQKTTIYVMPHVRSCSDVKSNHLFWRGGGTVINRTCTSVNSVYLWFYSPLLGLGPFFSFLIFYTVGNLWGRISPSQGCYLHTEQHKHRINTNRYPCLEWDSNPRSQRSSE